jgi:hypothetical protein
MAMSDVSSPITTVPGTKALIRCSFLCHGLKIVSTSDIPTSRHSSDAIPGIQQCRPRPSGSLARFPPPG